MSESNLARYRITFQDDGEPHEVEVAGGSGAEKRARQAAWQFRPGAAVRAAELLEGTDQDPEPEAEELERQVYRAVWAPITEGSVASAGPVTGRTVEEALEDAARILPGVPLLLLELDGEPVWSAGADTTKAPAPAGASKGKGKKSARRRRR